MTDVYTSNISRSSVTPGCRTTVSTIFPATKGDFLVPIPFRGRLVHAQSNVIVAVGGSAADITVSLEKDAAGGTSLGTMTVAASAGVGTEDTVTLTTSGAKDALSIDNQDICVAVTGSQASGMCMLYMIFESSVGQ